MVNTDINKLNNEKMSINAKLSEGHFSNKSTLVLNKFDNEMPFEKSERISHKENSILEINENAKIEDKEEDTDYIIKLRNLHKTYLIGVEGVPALRGVSLNIKRGEFVVILGTSGGGKTTLLNLIGTIDCPSRVG